MKNIPEITGESLSLRAVRGRLLLPKEVATFLRKSERTIQDQIQRNKFPIPLYLTGPKNRLIDSEDLNDYLEKIRKEAGATKLPVKAIRKNSKKEGSPM